MARYKIKPGETRTLSLDFTGKLPAGVGFANNGQAVAAVNHFSGNAAPEILGSTEPTISGLLASVVVTNVGLHERYEVTFTLTLDDPTPSVIKESVLVIGISEYS